MSKIILAIVVLAAAFHSFECLTQGAGALVGKRGAGMLAKEKKMILGPNFLVDRYVIMLFSKFEKNEMFQFWGFNPQKISYDLSHIDILGLSESSNTNERER